MQNEFIIRVESVSKIFKKKNIIINALDLVSLKIKKGEIFALIGPNGAGKTTLIKLMLNFIFPTKGNIFIHNYSVSSKASRKYLGYVPEEIKFPFKFSAFSFLKQFVRVSGSELISPKEHILYLLHKLNLKESTHSINNFSKGMKKRLSIAYALLTNPDILILDEPTDGLDPMERKTIMNMILDFKSNGGTVFLCSHILTEVEKLCDKFAIIQKGKIIYEGIKEEFEYNGFQVKFINQNYDNTISNIINRFVIEYDGHEGKAFALNETELSELLLALAQNKFTVTEIISKKDSLESIYFNYLKDKGEKR
ncbi:MAG: ABC transporter ATP-binding protein [Melioribacter sp.]|uniref:ABC transporter ATP-binding protein n=1 Tax=Rosettibacter primus TaxID=3111523 RepID=UPI00247C6BF4|nr:ABC transporter ATP-binding protein [Melioribacter sp.]